MRVLAFPSAPRIDANSRRWVECALCSKPLDLASHESSPLYGLDADANDRTHAGARPQSGRGPHQSGIWQKWRLAEVLLQDVENRDRWHARAAEKYCLRVRCHEAAKLVSSMRDTTRNQPSCYPADRT